MLLVTDKPSVIFDTSAINALYEDADRENRLRQLRNIYFPFLTFSVLDELLATPDPYIRAQLFDIALSLQDAGDCLLPFNYLLLNHVRAHADAKVYDWRYVNCYGNQLKKMILDNRHELTEHLVEEQRNHNLGIERQYKQEFLGIRSKLQEDAAWRARFPNFDDFARFALEENGPYWRVAASLIERALQIARDEEASKGSTAISPHIISNQAEDGVTEVGARELTEVCPPLKALLYGIVRSAYSRVHDPMLNSEERSKSAGRVDTYMSSYLPYCRFFVTNDSGQFDCLSSVVSRVGLEAAVFMYDDFWAKLPYN